MNIVLLVVGAIAAIALLVFLFSGYVKSPPDTAYIISGFKKKPRILIGQAGIKIPFFERLDKLLLKQITVDIKTEGYIPTLDFINIQVDAVAKVRVSTEADLLDKAMKNFLNKTEDQINTDLRDSLQGNMREIIGTISLKDICNNREEFGNQVQKKASVDMRNLGIEIISCNIQNVKDESDLIQNLGMDNTAKIRKDASIAKAEADRDVNIKQAQADKEANDARVEAELAIARKQNDLEIQKAELKKQSDARKAEAEMVFEITKESQRKILEQNQVDADIARREREVELKRKEAEVAEREYEATHIKKADAEKYAKEKEYEAELYKRQKEAEARRVEAEAEAEAIRVKGEAEANALRLKGIAEAEAIEKKADAMQKYGKAAMVEMIVGILPEMAKNIAEPITAIDKVSIIGGSSNGVSDLSSNVPALMARTIETIKETTGFDLNEVFRAETYDAKTTKNINITGLDKEIKDEVVNEIIPEKEEVVAAQVKHKENNNPTKKNKTKE